MKLLIELPTWLGDTVMATPAIDNLVKNFSDVEITILGSLVSVEVLKNHPNVVQSYVLNKNLNNFLKTAILLKEFDLFFSFRGTFRAKILKLLISANEKHQYDKKKYSNEHQVQKYNRFVCNSLNIKSLAGNLVLYDKVVTKNSKKKLLGINPGASYGSAKRWSSNKFAELAKTLSNKFDILIFGGENEKKIANDIENFLQNNNINNFQNLAGALTISELISEISSLDLFITGDSGPMHLASALAIPTVSIFGPTNSKETSQWMNKKSIMVKKDLGCQPCMKKSCPLKHHNCMKLITVEEVVEAVHTIV